MLHFSDSRLPQNEAGFTLLELLLAVVIFGLLTAIALPTYLNAQQGVASMDVKTGLVQAANLIEAEKIDNDQLYPSYMPNEVLANEQWRKYAYTYSNDRFTFCLQGEDQDDHPWYVSSTDFTPSQTDCTQSNLAAHSTAP